MNNQTDTSNRQYKQGWQLKWYGKSYPFCKGRQFAGPTKAAWVPIFLICAIVAAVIAWLHLRKYFKEESTVFFYFAYIVLQLLALYFFVVSSYTDPGVILRHHNYEAVQSQYTERKEIRQAMMRRMRELHIQQDIESSSDSEDITSLEAFGNGNEYQDEEERSLLNQNNSYNTFYLRQPPRLGGTGGSGETGMAPAGPTIYTSRFCKTCFISRPPLSSHCKHCDHCVSKFDHHCFLTNNCIGKRNMKTFVIFVNLILITSLIYVFSYYYVFLEHYFNTNATLGLSKQKILLNAQLLLVFLVVTELAIPIIRPLTVLFSLYYAYMHCITILGTIANWEILYVILYITSCLVLGTSLDQCLTYIYLTYQGITRKELRSIKLYNKSGMRCLNLKQGLKNMIGFYMDFSYTQSVFQKQYLVKPKDNDTATDAHEHNEMDHENQQQLTSINQQ